MISIYLAVESNYTESNPTIQPVFHNTNLSCDFRSPVPFKIKTEKEKKKESDREMNQNLDLTVNELDQDISEKDWPLIENRWSTQSK